MIIIISPSSLVEGEKVEENLQGMFHENHSGAMRMSERKKKHKDEKENIEIFFNFLVNIATVITKFLNH